MAERTTDLRSGLTVLRRRWYVVLLAALLGLGNWMVWVEKLFRLRK